MNLINPWLDTAEVSRLAERLMKPVLNPVVSIIDPGFDHEFVGFTNNQTTASPELADVVLEPKPVEISIEQPPQSIALPPFQKVPENILTAARGPFLDRIHRFRDWMQDHFSVTGMFILDRDGSVIFDESHYGRLHFLARNLAQASRHPGSNAGNVHVKIAPGTILEVIPVETAYGCLILGAIVPEAMTSTTVAAITKVLSLISTPAANS